MLEIQHSAFTGLRLGINEIIYKGGSSSSQTCWKRREMAPRGWSLIVHKAAVQTPLSRLTSVTLSLWASLPISAQSIFGGLSPSWVLSREAGWGLITWSLSANPVFPILQCSLGQVTQILSHLHLMQNKYFHSLYLIQLL